MDRTVITIVGARPQFIKAATVSRVLRSTPGIREVMVHTGQHYDDNMSAVFFDELEIPPPEHHLGVGSGSHGMQTGRMLEAIESILLRERPDWVLVYGDTNSTLAAALAAAKLHQRVAHVEAGLRSFNRQMPEETNRVLTDHVADLLFAPTLTAVKHLEREGLPSSRIRLVGDVMYDAAMFHGSRSEKHSQILESLGLTSRGYILGTIHRAENTDNPNRLRAIFEALVMASERCPVVLPLHPRTRKMLELHGLTSWASDRIQIIEPVGYLDMVRLERNARLIATDSGGVQKEAFFYRVPCITLRNETEWVELVDLGWNQIVPPTDANSIFAGILKGMESVGREAEPYGTGTAARQIVADLVEHPIETFESMRSL